MFETSNLTMKGWRMPDGSWLRIWVTRCITSIWPTLMSAPQLNHTWTAPIPCLANDSTCRVSGRSRCGSTGPPLDRPDTLLGERLDVQGIGAVRSEEHTSELQSRSDLV